MSQCPSCGETRCEGSPICGLKYIAHSPKQEHGGFAPEAIAIAKAAIREIYKLRRACAHRDKYFADAALQLIDAKEELRLLRGDDPAVRDREAVTA